MHTKVLFAFLVAFCLQVSLESVEAKAWTYKHLPKDVQNSPLPGYFKVGLDNLYETNPTAAKQYVNAVRTVIYEQIEDEPADDVDTTQLTTSIPEEVNSMSNNSAKNGDEVVKDNIKQID